MCGIAGIYQLNRDTFTGMHATHRMGQHMQQRGPNAEGYLLAHKDSRPALRIELDIEKKCEIDASLFLAHRRLSIIDLSSNANQPMSCDHNRYWIVFNGEIYNYREISQELLAHDVTLTTHSDTEVVLKSYALWGPQCLERFNGMFALAIWDDRDKSLFLARDRLGIKPLYYTVQDNRLIFASDIKTLIASKLYRPTLHMEGLYHTLSFGVAPRPMTCFANVVALEPAHWALISAQGNMVKQRYWRIPIDATPKLNETQAIEALDAALHRSVALRVRADVPVGSFLSGGIDSTCITAIAAQYQPEIHAFTLGHEQSASAYDETAQARATAQRYQLQHTILNVDPRLALNYIDDMIDCYEEPYFSLSPNYLISRLASQHNTPVILSGLGGDELFAGYRHFSWGRYHFWLRLLAPLLKPTRWYSDKFERASEFNHANSLEKFYVSLFANMSEGLKHRLLPQAGALNSVEQVAHLYTEPMNHSRDPIEVFSYMNLHHYVANHHLYRMDQFTMRFSLEGRFPLLDHHVVETAFRIPSQLKLRNGTAKYILRKVAEKYIDPSSLVMQKKGFCLPMTRWLKGSLKGFAQDNLDRLMKRDLFCPKEIQRVYSQFNHNRIDGRYLWQLVSIELWLRRFIDQQG